MNRTVARFLPVTATLALLLSACGASSDDADPIDSPDTTVAASASGLRAPTPIQVATGGNSGGGAIAADVAASSEMATDAMIAPMYVIGEFVVGDGMPALPTDSTGYVFDGSERATPDAASRVAAALGVSGDPVAVDDGMGSYRVGPDDGFAPSVWLSNDPMLYWNYSGAWALQPEVRCVSAGSTGIAEPAEAPDTADVGETVDAVDPAEPPPDAVASTLPVDTPIEEPFEECETPDPPVGVPTQAEAEQRSRELLAALGVDTANLEFEGWADEWSASVSINEIVNGAYVRSWNFGFGGEGLLQWAGGSLATPEAVGPYELVDLDTAVARLNDGRYGMGWPAGGDVQILSEATDSSDSSVGIAVAEAPVGEPIEEPGGTFPEPEEITVTLTDVAPTLWWVWDTEGAVWLVPAYRFTGDDGGMYDVPAVTDDFLLQSDEPIPVEPGDGDGDGATPPPDTTTPPTPISDSPVAEFVGLPLPEFEQAITDAGYGPVRVVELDGEPLAITMDLMDGRVDVKVQTRDDTEFVVDATVESIEPPTTTSPLSVGPVPVTAVYEGVQFYPACGDEILEHESGTWYQVHETEYPDLWKQATGTDREPAPAAAGPQGFARVVPPEEGDDIGTLTVWEDGVAAFTSDSGKLQTWLVLDQLEYGWTC